MEETKPANEEEVEYYDDITNEENYLKLTAGMGLYFLILISHEQNT